jgi:hypothetical protein
MKASSGEQGPRRSNGSDEKGSGMFTRKPDWQDFAKGAFESLTVEVFDQVLALIPLNVRKSNDPISLERMAVAALSGAVAGGSAGYESDDQADLVVQFLFDSFGTAFHVWGMGTLEGDAAPAGKAAGTSMTVNGLKNLFKIVAHQTFVTLLHKHFPSWSAESKRNWSRRAKIAINKFADEYADDIADIFR